MNLQFRSLYDQEFGHNVKQEVSQNIQNTMANAKPNEFSAEQSLVKSSVFGSFFSMINQKKQMRLKAGITEEMYINYHRKKYVKQRLNPPPSKCRSLCFVLEGSCTVVNPVDNFKVFELRAGNHFGASDLLRIVDSDFLGDIVAGEQGARVLVIPKPDLVLQYYEMKILEAKLKDQLDTVKFMLESKYSRARGFLEKY